MSYSQYHSASLAYIDLSREFIPADKILFLPPSELSVGREWYSYLCLQISHSHPFLYHPFLNLFSWIIHCLSMIHFPNLIILYIVNFILSLFFVDII
jgi:hypothetical protein